MKTALSMAFGYWCGTFVHAMMEYNGLNYDGAVGVGVAVACCALAMRTKE